MVALAFPNREREDQVILQKLHQERRFELSFCVIGISTHIEVVVKMGN